MRYQIIINQFAITKLKSKIKLDEAVLLDYLYWLCTSPSEEIEKMRVEKEGKKYTWFDYKYYIKENPILRGKTKATITPKIKKLEEEEFITTFQDEITCRKYIALSPKIDGLFRKLNTPVQKTKHPPFRKLNIDNNTNKDNNTINNKKAIAFKEQIDSLIDLFKPINPSYKQMFGNTTERGALGRLVKEHGKEKIENLLEELPAIVSKPYAPRITTPYQLEKKLGELLIFIKQQQTEINKNKEKITII